MDRREIEYVIVIAQEKTLSKAADRLFVSQPALSRFLLKLEDELGLPLFERRKRQLIPTYAGELYLATARSILQLQQKLKGTGCVEGRFDHGNCPWELPWTRSYHSAHDLTGFPKAVSGFMSFGFLRKMWTHWSVCSVTGPLKLLFSPCLKKAGSRKNGFAVS